MRKKIAILTYSLCGGGAERFVATLLNNLDRDNYDVHLVLMNTDIDFEIPANQQIHYIEQSSQYEPEWYKLIKLPLLAYHFSKYCKANQIELVCSVLSRPNMIATMAKRFGLKSRVLISERFYTPFYYNNASFKGKFKKWVLKKCYPKADCILPNSEGIRMALEKELNIKTDYRVIKTPTNIEAIKKLKYEEINDLINFKKFTFINVAGFRPEKNHDLLIEAAAEIKHKDFQLLLIGKGPLLEKVKDKVNRLGLAEKTIFIPFTYNPFKYLFRSSCFILPSFVEGFPNVLIESLACALPIISVDIKTGPRELLAPNTNLDTNIPATEFEMTTYGLLSAANSRVSLVAAMCWAMDNPEALKILAQKSEERVAEFDIGNVIKEISATFDKYLAEDK